MVTSSFTSPTSFRDESSFRYLFDPCEQKPLYKPAGKANLVLEPEDLRQLRFAFSPLWECVAAFRVCMNPQAHALFAPWYDRIRADVSKSGWELLGDVFGPSAAIPEFFFPSGAVPFPSLSDELDRLLSLPDDLVRTEIRMAFPEMPSSLTYALKNPSKAMKDLADLLERFWNCTLASDWTLLRAKLESELLYRARALAVTGLTGLFEGLHKDLSFDGNQLIFSAGGWDERARMSGLLVVPSVFTWPDLFFRVRPPWQPTIVYPCRGLAELWEESAHHVTSLEKLIGQSCAKIVQFLTSPRTTLETAVAVSLSTAAASEQITKLWRAGALDRTRIGTRVFYSLNEKGTALLRAFSM